MPWVTKKQTRSPGEEIIAAVTEQVGQLPELVDIDLGALTPAQTAAAQAAAAAVARAERALGLSKQVAGAAKKQSAKVTHTVGDDVLPNIKEAAQSAASAAVDRWPRGDKGVEKSDFSDALDEAVRRVLAQRDEADHAATRLRAEAADRASEAAAQATAAANRASEAAEKVNLKVPAPEPKRNEGGKPLAALFWLGSLLGLLAWLMLDERRREQTTRVAAEASTQVRELMRDLKGYDDEF